MPVPLLFLPELKLARAFPQPAASRRLSPAVIVFQLQELHQTARPLRPARARLPALLICRAREVRWSFAGRAQRRRSTAENTSSSRRLWMFEIPFRQRALLRFQPNRTPKLQS